MTFKRFGICYALINFNSCTAQLRSKLHTFINKVKKNIKGRTVVSQILETQIT